MAPRAPPIATPPPHYLLTVSYVCAVYQDCPHYLFPSPVHFQPLLRHRYRKYRRRRARIRVNRIFNSHKVYLRHPTAIQTALRGRLLLKLIHSFDTYSDTIFEPLVFGHRAAGVSTRSHIGIVVAPLEEIEARVPESTTPARATRIKRITPPRPKLQKKHLSRGIGDRGNSLVADRLCAFGRAGVPNLPKHLHTPDPQRRKAGVGHAMSVAAVSGGWPA